LFTGKGREEVAVRALNLGADGYINKQGSPETVYGELVHSVKSVVARRKAEEALRSSEEEYRAYVENSPVAFFVTNSKRKYEQANDAASKLLGYSKEELLGMTPSDLVFEEDTLLARKHFSKLDEMGKSRLEFKLKRKNGKPVHVILNTVKLPNGKRIAFCEDITERKETEETLRKEREELNCIINSSPIILFYKDKKGKFLRANRAFAEALQMPQEDFAGKSVFDLFSAEIAQSMTNDDLEVLESGCPKLGITEQYESASGLRWVQTDKVPIFGENGVPNGVIGFAQDITKRKKTEDELKKSEEKYRKIFDSANDVIMYVDKMGMIIDTNPKAKDVFGYERSELIGKNVFTSEFFDLRQLQKIIEVFKSSVDKNEVIDTTGKRTNIVEVEIRHKKGHMVLVEASTQIIEEDGNAKGFLSILRDVTERKKAEEKLSILNEKLAVVGKLTRHDVRNKLSAVVGYTYLAKKTLPKDHKVLDYLREIESACRQTTRVLDFAAAYESLGVEGLTLMDVDKTVEEAVSLISELKGVAVVNNCQRLTVMADSALKELFFNLIENSLKHGKNVSQIKIFYEEEKDRLKLFYEDNGVGIPKANKPKLFDWGFTTGKGSGYGLPLIKSMMELYGWTINEEGEPGKGAKFVITIPKTNITMSACNT